jgi:hypothetical protein
MLRVITGAILVILLLDVVSLTSSATSWSRPTFNHLALQTK